ncbi:unnamed protein product, partial [Didymodactylos carnosus]
KTAFPCALSKKSTDAIFYMELDRKLDSSFIQGILEQRESQPSSRHFNPLGFYLLLTTKMDVVHTEIVHPPASSSSSSQKRLRVDVQQSAAASNNPSLNYRSTENANQDRSQQVISMKTAISTIDNPKHSQSKPKEQFRYYIVHSSLSIKRTRNPSLDGRGISPIGGDEKATCIVEVEKCLIGLASREFFVVVTSHPSAALYEQAPHKKHEVLEQIYLTIINYWSLIVNKKRYDAKLPELKIKNQ